VRCVPFSLPHPPRMGLASSCPVGQAAFESSETATQQEPVLSQQDEQPIQLQPQPPQQPPPPNVQRLTSNSAIALLQVKPPGAVATDSNQASQLPPPGERMSLPGSANASPTAVVSAASTQCDTSIGASGSSVSPAVRPMRRVFGFSLSSSRLVPVSATSSAASSASGSPPEDATVPAGGVASSSLRCIGAPWPSRLPPSAAAAATAATSSSFSIQSQPHALSRLDAVRASPLGQLSLPLNVLDALACCAHAVTFKRDLALFKLGERSDCFILIARGELAVEVPSGADSAGSSPSPSSSPGHVRRSSLPAQPPISPSGFKARSRRMTAPLPLANGKQASAAAAAAAASSLLAPVPQPLQPIREHTFGPLCIAKSNLRSNAPWLTAEEDEPEHALADAVCEQQQQTEAEQATTDSPDSPTRTLCVKREGAIVGAEGLFGSDAGPRAYSVRCRSESVHVLIVSYADVRKFVLPLLQPQASALAHAPSADSLCRVLSGDWLFHAVRLLPPFRRLSLAGLKLLLPCFELAFVPADAVLLQAGETCSMDSTFCVLYEGQLLVSEPAESADVAPPPVLRISRAGSHVGEATLLPVAAPHSCTVRTGRPSLVFTLTRRAFLAVSAANRAASLRAPVPTLASIMSAAQADAAAAAAALSDASLSSSDPSSASTVPASRPSLRLPSLCRYGDSDLLLHPLFLKVLYAFAQAERPQPQHELLEFWRDCVNFRSAANRAQLSAPAEAAILQKAYLEPSAAKFQRHVPQSMRDAISAGIAAGATGCDPYLFASAEELTEARLIEGPLARFKQTSGFVRIAPFVRMDAKWLAKAAAARQLRSARGVVSSGDAPASAPSAPCSDTQPEPTSSSRLPRIVRAYSDPGGEDSRPHDAAKIAAGH